jgi:hypothetical protein
VVFLAYSVAVAAALWWRRVVTLRLNFYVLVLDQAFALALIHLGGGVRSDLYLALPFIAAVQSYYYGIRRGRGRRPPVGDRLCDDRGAHDRRARRGQRGHPHPRPVQRDGGGRSRGRRGGTRATEARG